ncbi:manganese efflux pump MntP family protein [Sporolactobacillus spathodeae]|uniref:Putative manganese efflux pump MntP n=1 Tax=Sporolactobacillus spathodeae TaxID=1465502 RepID=A0ABS2QDF9_9BACL|nr:manganese efflux pump MntP family protein [Sporolactobacillus spathodeae]MBM7658977.1 putative Mn2+ efflux pump MntP [Sporolactobacillus spathodeae]
MATEWMFKGFAIILMAMALGMDAFSVCMGMGMRRLRVDQIFNIGLLIGLFHILMPLLGMILGHFISSRFGNVASMVGGVLLVLIGMQMIFSVAKNQENTGLSTATDMGIILFAMSVSIDSFSVGLSMGLFGARVLASVFLFGLVSMAMAWAGFIIGRRTRHFFGRYGEALGGLIMFLFGLKLLLHFHL